jgi:hypothetical protein
MYDDSITNHVTPRDLVCHRTGVPRHDLVWYIQDNLSLEYFVNCCKYLENNKDLRSSWQYNNIMFCIAGSIIEKLTNKSWKDNVYEHIFHPLSMSRSNCSLTISEQDQDYALPYKKVNNKIIAIPFHHLDSVGPAGAINSCVEDMASWMILHLNMGLWKNKQLINPSTIKELHREQILLPGMQDMGYALGWLIENYQGYNIVAHDGGINGFTSCLALCPKEKIGVVILTNLEETSLPNILVHHVIDLMLNLPSQNVSEKQLKEMQTAEKIIKQAHDNITLVKINNTSPSHPLETYLGEYDHPAYGTIKITLTDKQLFLSHGDKIDMPIDHFHYDTFISSISYLSSQYITLLFNTNRFGEIDSISMPLEPKVKDIVFLKKSDKQLLDPSYLKQFVGQYKLDDTQINIYLDNTQLKLIDITGEEETLIAKNNNIFTCKNSPSERVHFIFNTDGSVKELWLENEIGITIMTKEISTFKN